MKSVLALALFVSLATAVCHYGTSLMPRSELVPRAAEEYGYNELKGPLNWHGLDKEKNRACALGRHQSPVNLDTARYSTVPGKKFHFDIDSYEDGAEFENLGHNVQAWVNGTFSVGRTEYAVQQFHFHTPSEHRIGSEYYPMEVHFVGEADDNSLAVIGFMIEVATSSDSISAVMTDALSNVGDIPAAGNSTFTDSLDFSDLAKHIAKSKVFSYSGSLTTPPCDEGVVFNVVRDPVYVDVDTFRAMKDVVKFNSRYTQNTAGHNNLLDNARQVLDSM